MINIPLGYKQTEVGVIPEDWDSKKLGDFVSLQRGHDLTERDRRRGGVPVMGSAGQNGFHDTALVMGPGVVLGRSGASFGQAHFCETDFWPHNTALYVTDFRGNDRLFVFYFLRSLDFRRHNSGGAQQSLNRNFIAPIPVGVPPLPEQEAIAEALSDADALIESLEQLIAKKRHLKQGAMQELLTGKRRLPGFAPVGAGLKPALRDDADIGGNADIERAGLKPAPTDVPHGWEVKRMGSLASISRGASPRPIDSPIWFDENSTIGWVRISDVTKSEMFLRETTQRLSPLGIKNSRPVNRGSLIMSICATVGKPVITEIDTCIHDGFVVFDAPRVNQRFLYYALKSIEDDWGKHGQTGSQMNLNTGLINRTEISVPNEETEQTAIATILSDMDAEIAVLETKLAKTRSVKQGMMHNLLAGRIRLL